MRRVFRIAVLLFAFGFLVLVCGWALSSAPPAKPDLMMGHMAIDITPAHRDSSLAVHIWYPAEKGGEPSLIGQNALFIGTWKGEGAAPLSGPHPLVLFSHGSGGNARRLGWFATALAQNGFVVAAPDHIGTTSGDSDPFQTPMVWQRTADISAILDQLMADPPLGLVIDPTGIAAAGFSLGGHTALALGGARLSKAAFIDYCNKARDELDCGWMAQAGVDFTKIDAGRYEADLSDPRIGRVLAVDPALTPAMTAQSLAAMDRPVLVVNLGKGETLPLGLDAAETAKGIPQAAYIALPGARHFSFLSECSTLGRIIIGLAGEDNICSDSGLRPRKDVHTDILSAALPFLSSY